MSDSQDNKQDDVSFQDEFSLVDDKRHPELPNCCNIRFATIKGERYLRAEDVAEYIRNVACTAVYRSGGDAEKVRELFQALAERLDRRRWCVL